MPRLKIQGSAGKIKIYEAYLQLSFIYSIKYLFSASYVLCSSRCNHEHSIPAHQFLKK